MNQLRGLKIIVLNKFGKLFSAGHGYAASTSTTLSTLYEQFIYTV